MMELNGSTAVAAKDFDEGAGLAEKGQCEKGNAAQDRKCGKGKCEKTN